MKTILIAADFEFWFDDIGARKRLASLYRYLISKGFNVPVFYSRELNDEDRKAIKTNFSDMVIYHYVGCLSGGGTDTKATCRKSCFESLLPRKIINGLSVLKNLFGELWKKNLHIAQNTTSKNNRWSGEKTIDDYNFPDQRRYFENICKKVKPDLILIEYIRLTYLIRNLKQIIGKEITTIIDTIDVMHLRTRRFHDRGMPHWINISEEEERNVLDQFDVILAIQNKEADVLERMLPRKKIITVGYPEEIHEHEFRSGDSVNLTFVGSAVEHNRIAIEKFIETTWPHLQSKFGTRLCLKIVGGICDFLDKIELPKNIILVGYVNDMKEAYCDADIIINPVFLGGGLKIKNVEALCNGKPLVTTTVGAEGLEQGIDKAFFVCDTEESMVAKLSELIENPQLRLDISQKAHEFAREHFDEDRVYQDLYAELTNHTQDSQQQHKSNE